MTFENSVQPVFQSTEEEKELVNLIESNQSFVYISHEKQQE